MFGRDRLVVLPGQTRTEYVTREVHEHRAPTDQSIALLKEMEDAAKAKVIASVSVADCAIPCELHLAQELWRDARVLRAIFSVNGEKMHEDVEVGQKTPREAIEALKSAIAERIAGRLLSGSLTNQVAARLFHHG